MGPQPSTFLTRAEDVSYPISLDTEFDHPKNASIPLQRGMLRQYCRFEWRELSEVKVSRIICRLCSDYAH
jgi:hypothetical protein